jgi:DNA helicase-2/ATP-dependent DNA helicase PcrA
MEVPENVVSYLGDLKKPKAPDAAKNLYSKIASQPVSKPVVRTTTLMPTEPFIADDANGLQAGMEVLHEKFGEGKVVSIEGGGANKIASIFFGQFGVKKIMLKFAKLKILKGGV